MSDLWRLSSKSACCHDLLSNLFDLTDTDLEVFFILVDHPAMTIDQVSEQCDRHRSTVFKILQKLESAGLVTRETISIRSGGYYHVYSILEIDDLERLIEERTDLLIKSIRNRAREFSSDIRKNALNMHQGRQN